MPRLIPSRWFTVADVTVIGDETTHGSDLRGSRLSVLETIAPSETVLDPIPEDDDPDLRHRAFTMTELRAATKAGTRCRTLCGKFLYVPAFPLPKLCWACEDIARQRARNRR